MKWSEHRRDILELLVWSINWLHKLIAVPNSFPLCSQASCVSFVLVHKTIYSGSLLNYFFPSLVSKLDEAETWSPSQWALDCFWHLIVAQQKCLKWLSLPNLNPHFSCCLGNCFWSCVRIWYTGWECSASGHFPGDSNHSGGYPSAKLVVIFW